MAKWTWGIRYFLYLTNAYTQLGVSGLRIRDSPICEILLLRASAKNVIAF